MTGRGMLLIWAGSALAAVCAFLLLTFETSQEERLRQSAEAALSRQGNPDHVFIGSSLTSAAIPAAGTHDAVFPHGRSGRLALSRPTRAEMLVVLDAVLKTGPETVLVETGPLISEITRSQPVLLEKQLATSFHARNSLQKILIGKGHLSKLDAKSRYLDQHAVETGIEFFDGYGLEALRPDTTDRWDALLREARSQGTEIVLVDYPRSRSAERFLPSRVQQEIRHAAAALAKRSGLAHFQPENAWEDENFADRAHFNRLGRNRYITELRHWWGSRG